MTKPHYLIYALAAAAGLLGYLFLSLRSRRLSDRPAEGSALKKYGEDIRLRDLFRLAVLIEEEGLALYLNMAAKASKEETRKLCEDLAAEETVHLHMAQTQLGAWRSLPPNNQLWPAFLEKVRQEKLFGGAPGPQASEAEMAAFAIQQEKRTAEFYKLFEQSFPDAWKRAQMHKLMMEELGHEARLRGAYPDIN